MNHKRIISLSFIASLFTIGIFVFITNTLNLSIAGLIVVSQVFIFYFLEKNIFSNKKYVPSSNSHLLNAEYMIQAITNNDFNTFKTLFEKRDYMKSPVTRELLANNKTQWLDMYLTEQDNIGSLIAIISFEPEFKLSNKVKAYFSTNNELMKYFEKTEPMLYKNIKKYSLITNIKNFS